MKKKVSISDLEQGDAKAPIWALNGSASSEARQPGEVHVGIPKANGSKVDDLYLPQTWLPVNLTDQIPRLQLLASSEFRGAVNNGLVIPISTEYAQQIEAQDGASEEKDRLNELKQHVRDATAARTISDSGAEIVSTAEDTRGEDEAAKPTELDASFVMFANNLGQKTDIEALNAIRGRARFNRRELRHLVKALKDKPKVQAFIKGKLATK